MKKICQKNLKIMWNYNKTVGGKWWLGSFCYAIIAILKKVRSKAIFCGENMMLFSIIEHANVSFCEIPLALQGNCIKTHQSTSISVNSLSLNAILYVEQWCRKSFGSLLRHE